LRGDPDALGDLAVHEREGDGDTEPALEDVGKKAVLRVVVVGLVAGEPLPLVKVVRELEGLRFGGHLRETEAHERRGELLEAREHRTDVEIVVRVARDERRAERHVDALLGGAS
jgi:hypothetical protein